MPYQERSVKGFSAITGTMRRFFSKDPNNGPIVLPNHPHIEVSVRHLARAKRLSLRVSSLDGRITLTAPLHARRSDIEGFVLEKEDWIAKHHSISAKPALVDYGSKIPIEGVSYLVTPGTGARVSAIGENLCLPQKSKAPAVQVQAYLKTLARDRLAEASDYYASKLGLPYTRLTLRDTRSRWGSCSSEGALMYSWRLIMAPPDVLKYVAAHEVAHLKEMNHSAAFWTVVEHLFGSYKEQRAWLRQNGASLHQYTFKD